MINRYFTPNEWNELGYMGFTAFTEERFSCLRMQQLVNTLFIMEESIMYYNFPILDVS